MPELPDITAYLEALHLRVVGRAPIDARAHSPFVVRTVSPPLASIVGHKVSGLRRLGKRIVLEFEGSLFAVIHLMIAGRLRWTEAESKKQAKPPSGRIVLATIEFENGTLALIETSTRKRASIHLIEGEAGLAGHDPGGVEPLECTPDEFRAALLAENRTLKRALANPRAFAGIGNAYSDEILHAARLSPLKLTRSLTEEETSRLFEGARATLQKWIENLRREFDGRFPLPGEITAFRPGFAVHGKFGMPCPNCAAPIQRIRYEENETNYCARCQNEGRLLADRALSRLLKGDWPKTLEELEEGR